MSKKIDLTGQRFGRLTAIKDTEKHRPGSNIVWVCQCECGNLKEVNTSDLKSGKVQSCGCLHKEEARKRASQTGKNHPSYKHGDGRIRLYTIWRSMKVRCSCPNRESYRYYGKRGIKVCPEWRNNYLAFKFWALLSGYQDNLTIDRIDNDGDYEPSNCQFITQSENTKKSNSV